jgi:hypothetical protein
LDIIVLQTADAFATADAGVTAPTAIEYAAARLPLRKLRRIKRGVWPGRPATTASSSQELLDRGRRLGLYLDADAWIDDLDFDLPAYLADKKGDSRARSSRLRHATSGRPMTACS